MSWDTATGGGGGGAPSGAAGGDLSGTYPNPSVAGPAASASTAGIAKLGATGGAAAYNDSRLSDARTPTAHQSSHRVGGSDALPTGNASTPGLLLLGASGGAHAYNAPTAPNGSAGGDLGGTYPNPTVTDLTIASEARGDILTRGSSAWQRLAAGTSGQVLQTGGAGADPSWLTLAASATTVASGLDGNTAAGLRQAVQPYAGALSAYGCTASTSGSLSDVTDTSYPAVQFSAGAASSSGFTTGDSSMRVSHNGSLYVRFNLGATGMTNKRFWIGFRGGVIGNTGTSSSPFAGVLVDTDDNAYIACKDATTQSTTSLMSSLSTSTWYNLRIDPTSSLISVNIWTGAMSAEPSTFTATHSTNIPATSEPLGVGVQVLSASGAGNQMWFGGSFYTRIYT